METFNNILYATDFSDCSEAAFRYALSLAKNYQARLGILHVINEPVDLRGFYVPHISFDKLEDEIRAGAEKLMEKFCRSHLEGFEHYQTFVVPGIPFEEVIKKAAEIEADLIIVGTHGRAGIDHVLFGSTAEKIVRKSIRPVLTVRGDGENN